MTYTNNIKKGIYIKFNNNLYKIIDFFHVKVGKGAAFIRTKLKNLINNKIIENTFPSGHKIKKIDVISKKCQYLYKDYNYFYFMELENYEQINLNKKFIKNELLFKEGIEVKIFFFLKKKIEIPISVNLPINIILKVIYTEPAIKGNSATNNSTKSVTLETGLKIQVPLFIKINEYIKINTELNSYIERINKKNIKT